MFYKLLFAIVNDFTGPCKSVRIDGNAGNTPRNKLFYQFGILGRGLTANTAGDTTLGTCPNRLFQRPHDGRIAFVEIWSDFGVVAIDAQSQHSKVVAADRNTVYPYIYKFIQQNNVGGYLHHPL